MKLHWVGEWKEGKSWNNPMESEGWAFLWVRVHGEGGRADKKEMLSSTGSEWVRQDRQAQQRLSMGPQGQGAKERNHHSQKKPFQWEQGWIHWKCLCVWDMHLPEGKSYWEEWPQWSSNAELPHNRHISCPHFLSTNPEQAHLHIHLTPLIPAENSVTSQFTKVFLHIRSTSLSKYLPHLGCISRNKRQSNEM